MNAKPDRFTRTCLLLIVLLLGTIAVRQAPPSVLAVNGTVPQYKLEYVESFDGRGLQKALDTTIQRDAQEGWRLLTVSVYPRQDHNNLPVRTPACIAVFQK